VHGLIFISFRDYLTATHGIGVERTVLAGEPAYLISEAYPDDRFSALVERACEATGLDRETLLRDFGVFTAEKTFARLYPALFDICSSAREFLLNVERPIHELVRVAIPNAKPPRLTVTELGENGVLIVYSSPRRMCALLRGLVEGVVRHYHEVLQLDERTCMHRGANSCTFALGFERAAAIRESAVSVRPRDQSAAS
jgi:predicted hydrocarbon binding protein